MRRNSTVITELARESSSSALEEQSEAKDSAEESQRKGLVSLPDGIGVKREEPRRATCR